MRVRYHRQADKKPLILGFISVLDAFFGLIPLGITMLFQAYSLLFVSLILYLIYGLAFRMNRPLGYGMHVFTSYVKAKHYRPGHLDPLPPVNYPEDNSDNDPSATNENSDETI